ncbi:YjgB family protein [Paenibacillus macerans]|uniref:YjgB family protein n=1 Tax=Paenibacillus macerans TaxID=44252 RepID=UPI002DBBE281|nr:YjgB family protein [Paenibacillus macerans]MEC0329105.1 YjgB family protein [Paenibacillus macerans]MED4954260.1 YjgB family protein [Paenibacillus macerans]
MKRIKKATVAIMAVGALTLSAAGITNELLPAKAAAASASASSATSDYYKQALQTLNRFYKPALQGQFPGLEGLTLAKSTHEDVIKAIGEPEMPAKASNAFDFYHAEMGHPGYAISYKGNKIQEMRYFGTNVEREANIGGITVKMLVQQWGAPHSSTVFKTGSIEQKKIVYIRGAYQLEFIFNSSTNLDHINLVYKA